MACLLFDIVRPETSAEVLRWGSQRYIVRRAWTNHRPRCTLVQQISRRGRSVATTAELLQGRLPHQRNRKHNGEDRPHHYCLPTRPASRRQRHRISCDRSHGVDYEFSGCEKC
eukprot:PhF_6_TR11599/c1_g3_i9/m.18795